VFFSDIIRKYPFSGTAYKNRGSYYLGCYASDKNQRNVFTEKAISDFESLLKYSSDKREKAIAYNNIGVAKSSLGDNKAAVDYYTRSIESDSTWNKAYSDRGGCYVNYFANTLFADNKSEKENYLKKATDDYERNLKFSRSQSENAVSLYNIGCIKFQMEDFQSSIEFFNKAIDIDNRYSDAFNNRGSARNILKDYDGAIKDFKRLIELNPKNGIAWFNLGVNQFAMMDYTNAIGSFSKSILLNGELAVAWSMRGNSYLKLSRYEEAIRDYDAAIKLNPADVNSINNRNIALSFVKK
jgi:tetratricopeptide (TPR) repeat protein